MVNDTEEKKPWYKEAWLTHNKVLLPDSKIPVRVSVVIPPHGNRVDCMCYSKVGVDGAAVEIGLEDLLRSAVLLTSSLNDMPLLGGEKKRRKIKVRTCIMRTSKKTKPKKKPKKTTAKVAPKTKVWESKAEAIRKTLLARGINNIPKARQEAQKVKVAGEFTRDDFREKGEPEDKLTLEKMGVSFGNANAFYGKLNAANLQRLEESEARRQSQS